MSSHYYVLNPLRSSDEVFSWTDGLQAEPVNQSDADICPACGNYVSQLHWLAPLYVELTCWGKEFSDFVFGLGDDFLVSERFRIAYSQSNLSGLSGFEKVSVARVSFRRKPISRTPPPYYRVHVHRGGAEIDEVRSEYDGSDCDGKKLAICLTCRRPSCVYPKRWKAIVVRPHTWSGEDIFTAKGAVDYLCTTRFVEFCTRNKVSNATFVKAEEYEYDYYPWENTERATELLRLPPNEHLLERIRADGSIMRYAPITNELVIKEADGTITLFRPLDGRRYWERICRKFKA